MKHDDPIIQAMRDLLVADRDESIAEAQGWANEAKAAGHEASYRDNQRRVQWLKAQRFPWENDPD